MRVYSSYADFVEAVVIPRRQARPGDRRLDGETTGDNWDVAGRFRHSGREWRVHEDSHYEPLLIAYDAARRGEDPFVEEKTRGGISSLGLRADLRTRQSTRHKHLYIYET